MGRAGGGLRWWCPGGGPGGGGGGGGTVGQRCRVEGTRGDQRPARCGAAATLVRRRVVTLLLFAGGSGGGGGGRGGGAAQLDLPRLLRRRLGLDQRLRARVVLPPERLHLVEAGALLTEAVRDAVHRHRERLDVRGAHAAAGGVCAVADGGAPLDAARRALLRLAAVGKGAHLGAGRAAGHVNVVVHHASGVSVIAAGAGGAVGRGRPGPPLALALAVPLAGALVGVDRARRVAAAEFFPARPKSYRAPAAAAAAVVFRAAVAADADEGCVTSPVLLLLLPPPTA
mmetsp:Transcript_27601/g.67898  ORF Transcript_27601/g.67898 Transcript_27601/m.67898 type:complete len:285 (+) Transcript_27601:6000-6854(+)